MRNRLAVHRHVNVAQTLLRTLLLKCTFLSNIIDVITAVEPRAGIGENSKKSLCLFYFFPFYFILFYSPRIGCIIDYFLNISWVYFCVQIVVQESLKPTMP